LLQYQALSCNGILACRIKMIGMKYTSFKAWLHFSSSRGRGRELEEGGES
jgi:hypothetical protein